MSEFGEIPKDLHEINEVDNLESQLMKMIPSAQLVDLFLEANGKNEVQGGLTKFQTDILKLYFKGYESSSIAQRMNNEPKTTSNLLGKVKEKLGINGEDETLRKRIWNFVEQAKSEGSDLALSATPNREQMVEMFLKVIDTPLTQIERDVLSFSFQDLSIKQIAEARGRSTNTIKNQIPVLKSKLGISPKGEISACVWETLENEKK